MTSRPAMPASDTPETDALLDFQNSRSMQVTPAIIAFARSLERRLAQAQTRIAELSESYVRHLIKLSEQQTRIAELEKDAVRYRWLKTNHLQTGEDSWIRSGNDLEEAIDAALKSRP